MTPVIPQLILEHIILSKKVVMEGQIFDYVAIKFMETESKMVLARDIGIRS